MLNIKNLSKTYKTEKREALKKVSLKIKKGEFVALLGQNGAGKSTLINVLAGNVKKDNGTVTIDNLDLDSNELETKKRIGVVPQEISFDFVFTVNEVLQNQSGYFGIKNNQKYIDKILKKLALEDKKHVNCRLLSGGMKRRLLIAKALIHKPQLLILDEPTAGVDIELRHSTYKFLKEMHKSGITIILTTHYLEEAEKLCDRIIMINQGEIIADESKDILLAGLGKRTLMEFHFNHKIDLNDFNFLKKYSPNKYDDTKLQLKVYKEDVVDVLQNLKNKKITYNNFKIENNKLEDVFLNLVNNKRN